MCDRGNYERLRLKAIPQRLSARAGISTMFARYILAALSIVFLLLAGVNWIRDGRRIAPQTKAWLLVGTIFGVVAVLIWN